MNIQRLLGLLGAVAAGPLALRLAGLDLTLLWAPQQLLLVAALPFILQALASGGFSAPRAFALAFASDLDDRPTDAREAAGSILRELGGLAVAVGALSFLLGLISLFVLLAATSGQASPVETIVGLGSAMLGPVYGILLKALVYDPLATAIEPAPGELAAAFDA
ncbi:hypothetical protein [Engelhardtia mirabilis]|uniref:MotA/TolQ/ExbB proton channel domain-containing protein n=1 Tax=Engelhardtia mirabilis TaxID=2528011 RepID=A0A518BNQ9_9BACT|nr:hypothetical protein Pla133_37090 [Planctomycetes bacterium Pla133]QDV02934.1 hypothetical protein Pla86_37070 [Planctomycetes bacterium Pla86]